MVLSSDIGHEVRIAAGKCHGSKHIGHTGVIIEPSVEGRVRVEWRHDGKRSRCTYQHTDLEYVTPVANNYVFVRP